MSEELNKRKIGVLLVNLGTPDAPTPPAVRRYLAEFLSDRRVVEIPRLIWLPILYGLILPLRPKRVARNYAGIWRDDGSPLLAIGRLQQSALQNALGDGFQVALGMRYGRPRLSDALQSLLDSDCRQVIVLPLYPQYSATTTGAVYDAVFQTLSRERSLPALNIIADYHDDPGYIQALADSIKAHWHDKGRGERLLMSFHGIPQRNAELGDPYPQQCERSAQLLAEHLELQDHEWAMTYQSRFGKAEWLQPYTDKTLAAWAVDGLKSVDVVCPGFAADCLETLEEIRVENAEIFQQAGGQTLNYIPALNDRPGHIRALAALVKAHSAVD